LVDDRHYKELKV